MISFKSDSFSVSCGPTGPLGMRVNHDEFSNRWGNSDEVIFTENCSMECFVQTIVATYLQRDFGELMAVNVSKCLQWRGWKAMSPACSLSLGS